MTPPSVVRLAGIGILTFCSILVADAQEMRPFTLPWDDATETLTDLSGLNTPIPLTASWVRPNDDGHLIRDAERLRFLGVNIGADSAFPYHTDADKIAARMAKFGLNSVRFHHLEAPWAPGEILIDYSTGRSRDLSSVHLDRLHHFVARLADHGIHTNMNLLVSRELQPGDGFPASISELEWKEQQSLGFFDEHALTLQKEYATQLLGAPNPWRDNTPLAHDPAVSFVEILNEYGYVQSWHDGTLDALPIEFATTQRTHWNDWLANRYSDTAALLIAWDTIDEPLGPQLLTNANFSAGTTGWNLEQHDTAQVTGAATTEFTAGGPALLLDITNAGSAGWHVQLNQSGLSLTAGQTYTVSFWAKADTDFPLNANLTRTGPSDYSSVVTLANTTLDSTWREFSSTFVATADEPSVRLNFGGFGARTGKLWLAAVSFTTGGQAGAPPPGTSLELRNLPTVRKSGATSAPTPAQQTDWIRYLLDAEIVYWDAMYSHIRDVIGYPGVIFGTIVANSPAGIQARLDAVDSHAYWQHPVFPRTEWDPNDWTIDNRSLVEDLGATIGSIARQRVKGKPFFCTEYQHPSPNTYSAEAPLLLSAYAAFQDWDGLWFFDYGAGPDEWDRGFISGFFAQDTHPTKMANTLLAATMFRRGDVRPAQTQVTLGFDDATQLQVVRDHGSAWQVGDGRHLGLSDRQAMVSKVMLDVDQTGGIPPPAPARDSFVRSDTGELTWADRVSSQDSAVTVGTPRTLANVGFLSGSTHVFGGWRFEFAPNSQDWLTVGVTAMEGESLFQPNGFRAVVVAAGNVENTSQQWTDETRRSVGTNWGQAPVLVEVVRFSLDVPFPADRVQAWALDERGNRTTAVPMEPAGGATRLTFGESSDTIWYELAVAADSTVRAPAIEIHPTDRLLMPGADSSLQIEASGTPPLSYTWTRNGENLPTSSDVHGISGATAADAGTYVVTVTNALGSVVSRSARVFVDASPPPSTGLANLSTRANSGTGAAAVIPGFVLAGAGEKEVLVRAIGPGLGPFGITTYLADPYFALLERQSDASQQNIAENDNWSVIDIGSAFTDAGAFDLAVGSEDAALRTTVLAGIYTAPVFNRAGADGLTLVELYDLTNGEGDLRLRNLASRGPAGVGADQLIAGFVIPGEVPRRVLIRAIGPTLIDFGVTEAAPDPRLEVIAPGPNGTSYRVAANDDWFRSADFGQLVTTMETVGAFALPQGSLDAAVLVELAPGAYTALVNSDIPGIALVEVYEVD
jgi:hypothetical protein